MLKQQCYISHTMVAKMREAGEEEGNGKGGKCIGDGKEDSGGEQ